MTSSDVADSTLQRLRAGTNNNLSSNTTTTTALHHRTVRVLVATTGVTYRISLYPAELT
jgi:hypothetical protein